jgi:hypothetical protein
LVDFFLHGLRRTIARRAVFLRAFGHGDHFAAKKVGKNQKTRSDRLNRVCLSEERARRSV